VLGQLELAAVAVQVLGLQAAQVEQQLVTGVQALVQAVPVAELDVARVRGTQLEGVGLTCALGQVVGELVRLEVRRG